MQTKYETEMMTADLETNAGEVVREINSWAAKNTDDMISELVPETFFDDREDVLVLINTVYFKGLRHS